jgi:predicted transporter
MEEERKEDIGPIYNIYSVTDTLKDVNETRIADIENSITDSLIVHNEREKLSNICKTITAVISLGLIGGGIYIAIIKFGL